MSDLYDVVAVHIKTGAKRTLATDKTEANAEAVIKMAVMRLGLKKEFYMAIPVSERSP
jgi:hypothetical protein